MKSIGKNNLFLEIYGNSQKLIASSAFGKKVKCANDRASKNFISEKAC